MKNKTIRILIISTLISVTFALFRVYIAGRYTYVSLAWNLFLAWIPLIISLQAVKVPFKENRITFLSLFSLWLLFFPNAPYLLTDLFHLYKRPGIPLWYDLVLILSFAWCGLMTGFVSLMQMQRYISENVGKLAGQATSAVVLLLGSFGVYLGRFGRYNSWDVFTDPFVLAKDILDMIIHPFANTQAYMITFIFGIFLFMCYYTIIALSNQAQKIN